MKTASSFTPHLTIHGLTLAPGAEWNPQSKGWCFIQVDQGIVYWIDGRGAREVLPGGAVVVSPHAPGCMRASQLGQAMLRYFCMDPIRLTGLASLGDQENLRQAAATGTLSLRFLAPEHPVADRFKNFRIERNGNSLALRISLLQIFIESFDGEMRTVAAEPAHALDARDRLRELLDQMPASELLGVSFVELAQKTHCTPRHLSRIFHELVGSSFRDKQTELRLIRARELLATTEAKIVDVALESGYVSLSLFNLLFKRHFSVSPTKWREQFKARQHSKPIRKNHLARADFSQ